jgi:hypothetical protein
VAVVVGAFALVLAGVGIGVVIDHDEDDDGEQAAVEVTTTTATFLDTTTSTTPEVASTTTSPPTTVRGGRTTTTRATSTTARPTTTRPGTQTTVAGRPLCAAEQMDISISLGTSYAPGQPVRMETTLRNKSSSPCFYRGYTVTMTFLDPDGRTLVGSAVHADDVEDRAFAPGQRITHDATWDPKVCQTPPCAQPPGIYAVTADWSFSGGRYTARQEFGVRAS